MYTTLATGFVGVQLSHEGSGRRWTVKRDLDQLKEFSKYPMNDFQVIRILGKNPFLWHDHWPVKDYGKIFKCLILMDEITDDVVKVVSKIKDIGSKLKLKGISGQNNSFTRSFIDTPYVAVHMRIEEDWMIHCKNLERRSNIIQICSSKEEIVQRVAHISGLQKPVVVYLAVADSLLKDQMVLAGWDQDLLPYEKKALGVWEIYNKYPYLIKSAIDYEVCLRAEIFVGNSFSTFSSLIVLERTQKLATLRVKNPSERDIKWVSYAYNIPGELGGPCRWMTDMTALSLHAVSYGSNNFSC